MAPAAPVGMLEVVLEGGDEDEDEGVASPALSLNVDVTVSVVVGVIVSVGVGADSVDCVVGGKSSPDELEVTCVVGSGVSSVDEGDSSTGGV